MQEQNFEKQVKQKMEELSLTPSVPVWKKVEEQIRKKKRTKVVIVLAAIRCIITSRRSMADYWQF